MNEAAIKDTSSKPDLTIILCVYNEMGRIQPALEDLLTSLDGRSETVEIMVLDNHSTDGTREWLRQLDNSRIRVELNERNLGKGGSIKKAIKMSHGQYVVIHDPDLEYRAQDVWRLFNLARKRRASLALGSRILGGQIRYRYLRNYIGVWILTRIICFLYGCRVTDAATAMKLMNGDLARSLRLKSNGFDLDFELVARIARLGGVVLEAPIEYHPRSKEEGKKLREWRDGLLALRVILRDRLLPRSQFVKRTAEQESPVQESTART